VKLFLSVFKKYYFINHTKASSSISSIGGGGDGSGKLVQVIG